VNTLILEVSIQKPLSSKQVVHTLKHRINILICNLERVLRSSRVCSSDAHRPLDIRYINESDVIEVKVDR